ncbi:MAG: class I SAM-dependent methyltransferase [Halioglobus sp.]
MKALLLGVLMAIALPLQAGSIEDALQNPNRLEADLERDARSKPEVVLSLLNIEPGDRVVDIFAGGGYYSELIGRIVSPGGEVLLHNNKAYTDFVEEALGKRMADRDVPGITRHDREVDNLDLGENSLDAAMIIMSYHDLYHTAEGWPKIDVANFMGQIVKALKPGGRFLLVDHAAKSGTGNSASQDLHRIEESFVRQDVQKYGLKFAESSDALRNPKDDHSLNPFNPIVRGKTDRFIVVFEKPL